MAVYIFDSLSPETKRIHAILRTAYKEIYILNPHSFEKDLGSLVKYDSLFILTGHYEHSYIKVVVQYCHQYQIPLLQIYERGKVDNTWLNESPPEVLFDVVTEPSRTELLVKVDLLLRFQKEVKKRTKKEKELERALTHLNEDLSFAKKIQQLVLPRETIDEKIKISAIYEPSELLSGDLYYWDEIGPNEYGLILIDVSGHGVHAALVSMAMRSLFPGLIKKVKDPIKIAQELNQHMLRMFDELAKARYVTSYFTAFILYINTDKKLIRYVNAGHQPGLLKQNSDLLTLQKGMVPIGLIPDPAVECETIEYLPDTNILLFTDGLTETPYSLKKNRLDQVKKSFIEFNPSMGESLLSKLLADRKMVSEVNDDICAILISL